MAACFPTTRWSRVLRAGDLADPRGRAALEELCRDYWFPLYAFVRRRGLSADEAEDIVQGFLADLLERGDLATMDQSKGRFRSFLRAACEHYLAKNSSIYGKSSSSGKVWTPTRNAPGYVCS